MSFPGFSLDVASLRERKEVEAAEVYDMLILGGGPSAMSGAVYAARKMITLAIISKDFGGQVLETSEIENYLGFQNINAHDLVAKFEEHVNDFDLPVKLGATITKIEKDGEVFKVTTDDDAVYQGRSVVLNTGTKHRHLDVPGERELAGRGVAYCATCDAPFYKGKKVVVAGGGNSAFTTALDLIKVDAEIVMVNYRQDWRGDPQMVERTRNYYKAEMLDRHEIVEIRGKSKVESVLVKDLAGGERKTIAADGVFVEIGLSPNSEMVKGLCELTDKGEVVVDYACRTSLPGLFAAGDVTTVPFKQIVISAGEGAKAALAAHEYLLENRMI